MAFSKLDYLEGLRGADLTSSEFRVLVVIVGYANSADGKNAHPGVERLAGDCGMTERSVKRCLKALTGKGWVRQGVRGGRDGSGQSWASSYELSTPGQGDISGNGVSGQGDISGHSTGHSVSLKVTNSVAQGDTSVTPPGSYPVLIPGVKPGERCVSSAGACEGRPDPDNSTDHAIEAFKRSITSSQAFEDEGPPIYASDCDVYGDEAAEYEDEECA